MTAPLLTSRDTWRPPSLGDADNTPKGTRMNTAELADHIAGQHGMDRKQAKQVVEAVLAAVVETAVKGEEVSLAGFGKFKVASRDARQGRNPATGETIQIAASKKLAFTPAKQVKDAMNPVQKPAPKAAAKAAPKVKAKAKK